MDVIGHGGPTATATKASSKLTNGTARDETITKDVTTAGSGRKKTKRKNRAKNSQREETTDTAATSVGDDPSAVSVSPSAGDVNSSHSSNHASNGVPEGEVAEVDAISRKLEQCVHVSRTNGLTNGLPKLDKSFGSYSQTDTTPRGEAEQNDGHERSPRQAISTAAHSKKGKQRSKQQKRAQDDGTHDTAMVNGGEQEFSSVREVKSPPSDSAGMDAISATGEAGTKASDGGEGAMKDHTITSLSLGAIDESPSSRSSTSTSSISLPSTGGPQEAPTTEPPIAITYQVYESERQMPAIMALIQKDLSEPYSIYTYRYFIHNWPKLCFLALHKETCVGAIVCKLDIHRENVRRGYIAMLAVDKDYRKLKIGTTLVQKAIQVMLDDKADEVVLETEITNQPALRLYENLGFVRDKRLFHYYLNGVDALRLKLWFR
ncbi:N-alpha-acetyltransferase 30 [Anopheles bellator]|uniref:N-alpha-acetyltransferase 30 n=1 Tax=Anopheles bellator TaxID=139047 RepID=UPI00264990B1|nr:N-alpha-acetyltransferase 30 [Anopheles bellator]